MYKTMPEVKTYFDLFHQIIVAFQSFSWIFQAYAPYICSEHKLHQNKFDT